MPLSGIAVANLVEADLQRLIDNRVPEGRRLEYKQELPGGSDPERREFLKDISAMANGAGGDMYFGISEDENHNPEKLIGVELSNWDELQRNLSQRLQDGIRPRIMGVQIDRVALADGRFVVVMRIPRSLQAPHMVTFQNTGRFYLRHINHSEQMDVDELRQVFLQSASWMEQAQAFREQRVSLVIRGLGPVAGRSGQVFLHIVPLGERRDVIDMRNHEMRKHLRRMLPMGGGGDCRTNFDGWLTFSNDSYAQVFRNGRVELCHHSWLNDDRDRNSQFLASQIFAQEIRTSLRGSVEGLKLLEVEPPFVVFFTLCGTRNLAIPSHGRPTGPRAVARSFDRDELWFPGQILDSWDASVDQLLKSLFDILWNASGWTDCPYYDDNGTWMLGP